MERIWLKSYEPGIPADIDPDRYASLNDLFVDCFIKYKALPAFTNMGVTLSFGEVEQEAKAFASFLQNKLQLAKGDRFAIMLPNILQYPIAMLGILLAGGTVVNVNPMYTADELKHQLQDSKASGILVLENFAHTVAEVLPLPDLKHIVITRISDVFSFPKSCIVNCAVKYVKKMVPPWKIDNCYWFNDAIEFGSDVLLNPVKVTGKDLAFLQYTGGTTGVAKGAMLTHRNLVANVEQATAWLSQIMTPSKEIIITPLPLYHIFSLTANCLTFIWLGGLNVLITNPRDTKAFLKEIRKYKFTVIIGVNTLFNSMMKHPLFKTLDFSALKLTFAGAMAIQQSVAERWQKLTKTKLLEGYGLTEASPAVCINPMNLQSFNGSIGLPIPSTEISIRDDKNHELNVGETGELCVRGPQVMRGYWNNKEETDLVLSPDGWLRTGDIAVMDAEGFIRIVDRKKDMILVSGFNVYPNEIEDVIAGMPEVFEVAVIGIPDPAHGESVKAFIVKSDPSLTEQEVINYCHKHLTPYKIPRFIEFRGSLPKSNVGKVLRRALR